MTSHLVMMMKFLTISHNMLLNGLHNSWIMSIKLSCRFLAKDQEIIGLAFEVAKFLRAISARSQYSMLQ